jgi:hypothetical protein
VIEELYEVRNREPISSDLEQRPHHATNLVPEEAIAEKFKVEAGLAMTAADVVQSPGGRTVGRVRHCE